MDEHQELEKPISESRYMKFRRSSRVFNNGKTKNRLSESKDHHEELSCYYGLDKTHKSPPDHGFGKQKRKKKSLVPCEECGKGFRYEKCLLNHRQVIHPEESMRRRSMLCSFDVVVQRRKRSKRVLRHKKKIPLFSVDDDDDGELLHVAESLILLSMSGCGEFLNSFGALSSNPERISEDGFLSIEQKLVVDGEFANGFSSKAEKLVRIVSSEFDGTREEFADSLGDKKAMKDEQKRESEGLLREEARMKRASLVDRPGVMFRNAETGINWKLGCQETAFGDSKSGSETINKHKCWLCDKVFSSHQALGGHQTVHRRRNKLRKDKHTEKKQ